MLEFAQNYKEALEKKKHETWGKEKYWYYNCCSYFSNIEIDDNTWSNMQFVSVDKEGNILGYLAYSIDREARFVDNLAIINFTDNPAFGIDVMRMIKNIFEKYRYRKIEFFVVVGNPIEPKYDRLVSQYGGRIVGTFKEHFMLPDGELYDYKMYEIFREDYINSRKSNST